MVPLTEGQAAPPTRSGPLERQIVIKEGPDNGLSLQGTAHRGWLMISGPLGQSDESDTAVLFSDLSQLAVSSKAAAESLNPNVELPGNTATLRELGLPFAKATMLQPRVWIGLDQTKWGRSVRSVRVHLLGSYTPTPANLGGQIVASVGGEKIIDHWPTDGQGAIDRWIDVPDRLLQRYTTLDLMLNVSNNARNLRRFLHRRYRKPAAPVDHQRRQHCAEQSRRATGAGWPPVGAASPDAQGSGGHQAPLAERHCARYQHHRWPAANERDTDRHLRLDGVQQAIDSSSPAILVAADGWNHPDVVLPVAAGVSGPITINAIESGGKPVKLELDPALRFASLQTVFNKGRSLLIATSNGAAGQLDGLSHGSTATKNVGRDSDGVAAVFVPGQDPVSVDQPNAAGPARSPRPESHSDFDWLWWFGGAWLVVAAIGGAVILLRIRRGLLHRR